MGKKCLLIAYGLQTLKLCWQQTPICCIRLLLSLLKAWGSVLFEGQGANLQTPIKHSNFLKQSF